MQEDAEPQEPQNRELVVHMVRNHDRVPSSWCAGGIVPGLEGEGINRKLLVHDQTPNAVTPDSTYDFPPLRFLPHTVSHLCYDGVAHEHGG